MHQLEFSLRHLLQGPLDRHPLDAELTGGLFAVEHRQLAVIRAVHAQSALTASSNVSFRAG